MRHAQYIGNYLKETSQILEKIDQQEIDKFIDILYDVWNNNKKVITFGNGGSASTASHFAADLLKTVANDSSMKNIGNTKGFKALCLNDNNPALTAWINDSGWDKAYSGLLHTLLDNGDVILLLSVHGASGWSGNLVEAMKLFNEIEAEFGIHCAIVDASNIAVHTLGSSDGLSSELGVSDRDIEQIIADNPAGQSDEQTPIILVRKTV